MAGLSIVGRDYYGVFALRGKLLNVWKANKEQTMKNSQIQNIMDILGLEEKKVYPIVKSSRYGRLMIMMDKDLDGSHIKGLVINFINWFWPSLLKLKPSFIVEFITPVIKATKKLRFELQRNILFNGRV